MSALWPESKYSYPPIFAQQLPESVKADFEADVIALEILVTCGLVLLGSETADKPYLRFVPPDLLACYDEGTCEVIGRVARGCLDAGGVPDLAACRRYLTAEEIEENDEASLQLIIELAKAFREYRFLWGVPFEALVQYGYDDTVEIVAGVARGMIEARAHPEWTNPHLHYVRQELIEQYGDDYVDLLRRIMQGLLEGENRANEPAEQRYVERAEMEKYGGNSLFTRAAIIWPWRFSVQFP
jgi:hypothetical protein